MPEPIDILEIAAQRLHAAKQARRCALHMQASVDAGIYLVHVNDLLTEAYDDAVAAQRVAREIDAAQHAEANRRCER